MYSLKRNLDDAYELNDTDSRQFKKYKSTTHESFEHLHRINLELDQYNSSLFSDNQKILELKQQLGYMEEQYKLKYEARDVLKKDYETQWNLVKSLLCHHGVGCRRQYEVAQHKLDKIHDAHIFASLQTCPDGVDCRNAQCTWPEHVKRSSLCFFGITCAHTKCNYVHDLNEYMKKGVCFYGRRCSDKKCSDKHL